MLCRWKIYTTEVNLIWNRCDKSRRSTLWWPPPACGQLLSFITVKGGENSFSRWNWNWIMLPQMLTGDLDSSLANLASNLDFGNGAKKWGNCFLIHFGGKIASERNQPKSTEWICKNTFFLGTYYRVGRVVPQWPRCIENFLLSVTIIPVFGLISGVCIVCIFLIHPWLSRSLSHCCRFRVLPPSLVNKHSLLWWDFTEWSKCWQSPFPFTAFLKKAFTIVWHFHNCMILLRF